MTFTGVKRTFWGSGTLSSEVNYKDGLREGSYKMFYPTKQLKIDCYFVNDKLNGPYKSYYRNGQLSFEGNFIVDCMEEPCKSYYLTGQIKEENIGGKFDLKIKYYDGDGHIERIFTWNYDPDAEYDEYYPS